MLALTLFILEQQLTTTLQKASNSHSSSYGLMGYAEQAASDAA
jgi:hypothetical protein